MAATQTSEQASPAAPILFLDVDGVLCLAGPGLYVVGGAKNRSLHGPAVEELEKLLSAVDDRLRIVVSSSWRQSADSMDALKEKLRRQGMEGIELESTPVIARHRRDEEIAAWLEANVEGGLAVAGLRFAVLDDSGDEKFGGKHAKIVKEHLVRVGSAGFGEPERLRAVRLLRLRAK
jgi:HAD domain in Swiss Army Knife RNA repair proteins